MDRAARKAAKGRGLGTGKARPTRGVAAKRSIRRGEVPVWKTTTDTMRDQSPCPV